MSTSLTLCIEAEYPPPDSSLRDFMLAHSLDRDEVQSRYQLLLAVAFNFVAEWLDLHVRKLIPSNVKAYHPCTHAWRWLLGRHRNDIYNAIVIDCAGQVR